MSLWPNHSYTYKWCNFSNFHFPCLKNIQEWHLFYKVIINNSCSGRASKTYLGREEGQGRGNTHQAGRMGEHCSQGFSSSLLSVETFLLYSSFHVSVCLSLLLYPALFFRFFSIAPIQQRKRNPIVSRMLSKSLSFQPVRTCIWRRNSHLKRILFSSNFLWVT